MEGPYRHMNQAFATLSMVKQLLEEGKYWDVQVKVGEKLFNCQRSILAVNSEYFNAKFSDDNSADEPITLPTGNAKVFETLLHFIYTGEILPTDSTILPLLDMGEFLRLRTDHFKVMIVQLIRERSQKGGPMLCALDLLRHACDKEENELVEIISAHVCRHLYLFSEELPMISFKYMNALLAHCKNYIVPLSGSADVLVKIVHNWVNCNRKLRSQDHCKLLGNIDFANVSSDVTQSLVNRLNNAVDEALNLPGEVKLVSQLESLAEPLEVGRGKTLLWTMISLHVPHVSRMPQKGAALLFSPSCTASNLSWQITLERTTSDDVNVSLCCDGTNLAAEWNCYADAIFVVVSHKKGGENFKRGFKFGLFRSCDPTPRAWVLRSFLPWNELVDPEKGYVAADDSLTLKAHVRADVPFLSYGPKLVSN